MDKLIEAAREFWQSRWHDRDFNSIECMAAFADQQVATAVAEAVKAERERMFKDLQLIDDEPYQKNDSIRARNFENWFHTEFAKELENDGK